MNLNDPVEYRYWEEEVQALTKTLRWWFVWGRKAKRARLIELIHIGSQYYEHGRPPVERCRMVRVLHAAEDAAL